MGSEKSKHVVATGGGPQTDTASDTTNRCCYIDVSIALHHPFPSQGRASTADPFACPMLSPRQPQDGGQHRTTRSGFLSYPFACVVLACGRRETLLCGVPRASGERVDLGGGDSPRVLMRVQFSIDHFLLHSSSVQRDVTVCCLQGVSVTANCIRSWANIRARVRYRNDAAGGLTGRAAWSCTSRTGEPVARETSWRRGVLARGHTCASHQMAFWM